MGAPITSNHTAACGIIRAIIPGDGCVTLSEVFDAAELLGLSPEEMFSRCSYAAALPA